MQSVWEPSIGQEVLITAGAGMKKYKANRPLNLKNSNGHNPYFHVVKLVWNFALAEFSSPQFLIIWYFFAFFTEYA